MYKTTLIRNSKTNYMPVIDVYRPIGLYDDFINENCQIVTVRHPKRVGIFNMSNGSTISKLSYHQVIAIVCSTMAGGINI